MSDRKPVHHSIGDGAELGIDGLSDVTTLGTGGSSTVYKGRQELLDRTVAIKVIHSAWNIETRERFEREREVMGRLSGHSAIVPIFETGITKRGEPYLLMPLYERGSLFRLLRDKGPMQWREATFMLETLADTLAESHVLGIVHRDVKPGNVLLTDHLQPRLSDFGITLPTGAHTTTGSVAFTPSYSPPETFSVGPVFPAQDVYGLGATLWALLAGRAPFTHVGEKIDVDEIMVRATSEQLERPNSSVPDPIFDLIERSMAKSPKDRPRDAGVFAAELRRAVRQSDTNPIGKKSSKSRANQTKSAKSSGEKILTIALIGLVIAGVALLVTGAVMALT